MSRNVDYKTTQMHRALMRTINCLRSELSEIFLSCRTVEREDFNFSSFYVRRPFDTLQSGSGNQPEWQHSLPLSEVIPQRYSAEITSCGKPSHDSYVLCFLRTFKGLLQTFLDFQSLLSNGTRRR